MIKTYGDRQPGLGTSAIVGALTLAKTGTTARTATFPDAAITVAGSASALTSGRVPFVTTGGLLTDSDLFVFSVSAGLAVKNTTVGASALAQIFVENDSAVGFNFRSYSSASTTVRYGITLANWALLEASGGSNAGVVIGSIANVPVVFGQNNAERFRFNATALTSLVAVTVPNGTAAAPGIRLTSEASGLYRVSATSLGFAVAGTAAASLTSAGALSAASLTVTGGASAAATVYKSATFGLAVQLATGSSYDGGFLKPDASAFLWYIPTGTGNVVFPSGSIVVGTTALAGSERARFTGGTMGTPGATDVLIGGGAVSCGATLSATGLRATTGFHEGPINGGITFNAYYSAGWKYRSNGYASALTDNAASGVILQVAPTGLADAAISWQAVFTGTPTTLGFASAIVSTFNNTTDATTTSDGSVRLSGGLSVAKNIVTGQSALFTAATAAGTTAGQLQRETNQDKLYAYANGIGGWLDKCIFSQYASVTQSGIVTDQSLASATARGTRTLPANFFKAGKVLKFRLCGRYTTDAAAGNATIQIKLGTTVFRTSGSFALDNSVTNMPWELEGEIICLTTGASGTVEGISLWKHMITGATGNYDAEALAGTTSVTLDTTASQAFDVIWTATDAGTAITCTCFRLWEVC